MFRFDFREKFQCAPAEIIRRSMYDFDEYEKYAPNVTRVEVLSREKRKDGREHITIKVFAKGWLPPMVMKMFKQEEVNWKEQYTVDLDKNTVDWKVETPVFSEYVDCKGTSVARSATDGSELVITGGMTITVPPVKGMPPGLVRPVFDMLEPFIGKLVIVNLRKYFSKIKEAIEKENRKNK